LLFLLSEMAGELRRQAPTTRRRRDAMVFFRSTGLAAASSSLVFAVALAVGADAQMSGFAATPLLQSTVEGDANKETAMLSITIAPGGSSGRHTHPGDCYGTVFGGRVELRVDGREPRLVSVGEAWHNPRGAVHELRNTGEGPAQVVNTLVVDQGKPRMQPVP
jgi:quercetin dioxygenase-like cupin family protein